LLEAVVFAERISRRLRDATLDLPGASTGTVPADLPQPVLQTLRTNMANDCGVVRNEAGLTNLVTWLRECEDTYGPARAIIAARLVAEPALARKESRGGHYRDDYKHEQTAARSFIRADGNDLHIERPTL